MHGRMTEWLYGGELWVILQHTRANISNQHVRKGKRLIFGISPMLCPWPVGGTDTWRLFSLWGSTASTVLWRRRPGDTAVGWFWPACFTMPASAICRMCPGRSRRLCRSTRLWRSGCLSRSISSIWGLHWRTRRKSR